MELPPYGPEPYASANSAMPAYSIDGSIPWSGGMDSPLCLTAGMDSEPSVSHKLISNLLSWAKRMLERKRSSHDSNYRFGYHLQSSAARGIGDGGRGWIRTIVVCDNGFTVRSLWPLGNPSVLVCRWSWWTDLNRQPADYKSAALPIELHQHGY